MGNWWLEASSWQCGHSCITCRVEFFGETWNHAGDSALPQSRFGALQLLTLPKTKITFEREEISDHQWDSGKNDRAADGNWENCVSSQGAYFEGDWGIIVLCTLFLVSHIFFNKCHYFHSAWLDTFWTDLVYPRETKTYIHTKICRWMLIAALFLTVKRCKKAKCNQMTDKMLVYSCNETSLSHKGEEILICANTWCYVKEVRLKKSSSKWSHVCEMARIGQSSKTK